VNLPHDLKPPKFAGLVRDPFTCPKCGKEKTFGLLAIYARHCVRRCTDSSFDESLHLPEIKKRIIYLDQFVISNMMKELEPANTNAHPFYRPLFEKLDRLSKLQLIVCPESPIQDYESAVDPRYEKFRAVFRLLSHGISFHDATMILHAQIMRAFRCWLTSEPCQADVTRGFALTKDPDVFGRSDIESRSTTP
jgi:hypothetical protein